MAFSSLTVAHNPRRDSGVGFMRLLGGVDQNTLSLSVRG
jgi:hypothetical protein